jgi:hypothetical protein
MKDYGGVSGTAYEECEECHQNDGDYRKSSHWNHDKDTEDTRRMKENQRIKTAYKGVKPLRRK